MAQLKQITPFVPCSSLARQLAFYTQVLGFKVGFQADNYAYLHRDNVALRLVEVDGSIDLKHPQREGSFYIDVDDVDGVYAAMSAQLDTLPKGRVRAPFDQDYGQREFHVSDEDCTLIFFGQPINPG